MARTDFSKVRRPIYEQYPEWAYVSPAGEIVDYNGDVAVCLSGPYQQHFALNIIEGIVTTLNFNGIFFKMGGFQDARLQRQLLSNSSILSTVPVILASASSRRS